ncbi:phosphatidylethanolamine-binding protein [Cooperia oncophora]
MPCLDADAPSRKDPHLSEFLHWLVINIPGQSINRGSEEFPYRPPRPPVGTGPHRYYLLVFKQEKRISARNVESRARFDALAFARQNGMGEPIAGIFFKVLEFDLLIASVHSPGFK